MFTGDDLKFAQDLFDFAAHHMFRQGDRAMRNGKPCLRADDGKKSFLGALISDDDFNPEFEHAYTKELLKIVNVTKKDHQQLVDRLEMLNLQSYPWVMSETMARSLNEIAQGFGLSDKVLATAAFEDR